MQFSSAHYSSSSHMAAARHGKLWHVCIIAQKKQQQIVYYDAISQINAQKGLHHLLLLPKYHVRWSSFSH